MMKKITSYNERGRTLTETLAMLAIVGILSVVGMRGYTSAMDKSRANTLIQEAQKRAVIVAGQIGFNNQTPSLAEFAPYNTTSSGTFGEVITKGLSEQFGIQVSNVNKSICQNILNTIGDKTPIRRLSHETTPTTPITSCDEDNAFLFIYNNDMTGENDTQYCESDESCGACGVCSSTTHLCEGECTPPTNECDDDTDCNSENECMICDTQTHKCKDGCERVQYLESTGTQWIDTGVGVKSNTIAKAVFSITSNVQGKSYFGARNSSNERFQIVNSFGVGAGYFYNTNVYPIVNKRFEIEMRASGEVYLDGIKRDATNGTFSAVAFDRTLYIFHTNYYDGSGTPTSSKFWKVQVLEGDVLVRDFIPVIAPNGKACMFNKVKEDGKLKLYCDANNGTFKTNKD